ncbi:unnamed protein product [Lupinus luteus]|uniref:Uncharacterized protein n=1 Tax=Lupinus luteus TaxID=3873 RepID=A0AAV1VQW4_LUPLU
MSTMPQISTTLAYVSAAGNDYMYYLAKHSITLNILFFIPKVVDQISKNLLRIQELGVKKIVVGDLPPLDCIPLITNSSSFTQCNAIIDIFVLFHNVLLTNSVTKLNKEQRDQVLILDLHNSFKSVIKNSSNYNIQNPLTPCCVGVSGEYNCGSVVDNGEKKYKVCDEPKSAFYWDVVHPTQAGWKAVFNELQRNSALQVFYETNQHTSY